MFFLHSSTKIRSGLHCRLWKHCKYIILDWGHKPVHDPFTVSCSFQKSVLVWTAALPDSSEPKHRVQPQPNQEHPSQLQPVSVLGKYLTTKHHVSHWSYCTKNVLTRVMLKDFSPVSWCCGNWDVLETSLLLQDVRLHHEESYRPVQRFGSVMGFFRIPEQQISL